MAKYQKDHSIDGHPICDNGEPMSKQEIIEKLNEYDLFKTELVDSVAAPFKAHIAGVIAVCEQKVKA